MKLTRFVQIQEVRPVVQPLGEPSLLVAVVSARADIYISAVAMAGRPAKQPAKQPV